MTQTDDTTHADGATGVDRYDADAICGYRGTHFRYKAALGPGRADPAACLWDRRQTAA